MSAPIVPDILWGLYASTRPLDKTLKWPVRFLGFDRGQKASSRKQCPLHRPSYTYLLFESYGLRDKEVGLAMTDDTTFRIASMTKAITGVAVMMRYEEGRFSLHDPISKYIPSFKESRVLVGGVPVPDKTDKSTDKKDWSQADLDQWLKENWESLSDEDKKKWTDCYAANGKGNSKGKSEVTETWEDAETVPANRPNTIRDLLRHTAGITYNMGTSGRKEMTLDR